MSPFHMFGDFTSSLIGFEELNSVFFVGRHIIEVERVGAAAKPMSISVDQV